MPLVFKALSIEIGTLALFVILTLVEIFGDKKSQNITLSKLTLLGIGILTLIATQITPTEAPVLNGMLVLDGFSVFMKGFFLVCAFFIVLMSREFDVYFRSRAGEFYLILVVALLGALFVASANNFLTLFIAIELTTLSLYILASFLRRNERSIEAGSKYLLMGIFSSAILLYGISFIYGVTQSFSFDSMKTYLATTQTLNPLLFLGFFMVISGIGFKIAAFPFQLWAPDVYEGAPTPVVAFLSTISKGMGFAALLRFLFVVADNLNPVWIPLMALLSAATLLYGNLGALAQLKGSLKRLLGFSSISHAGYLLMGIAAGSKLGVQAVLYYLPVYALANLAILMSLILIAKALKNESIPGLRGLATRSPFLAAAIFISLLSLAGIPPLAGFFAKFLLLQAAIEQNLIWLALIGALGVVISLFYYLSVVRQIYVEKPETPDLIIVPTSIRLSLFGILTAIILLGIFQHPLLDLISQIV